MIPKKFNYFAPTSLDEAVRFLSEDSEAKVLAGGQSLLVLMKLRLAAPSSLVDITKLPGLSYVRDQGDYFAIGALTTHDEVEQDRAIKENFTLLNDAVSRIGDQQVRNRGTIGGSACHADPAADLPTALLVADARFVIRGRSGERVIPARDFFVDMFVTAVGHDEILTGVRLPHLPPRSASAYTKQSLRESDSASAAVGVVVTLKGDAMCEDLRIGIGGAGPIPLRSTSAESYLRGRKLDETKIAEASERAVEGADPPPDVHGSKQYKLEMIKVLTRRSLNLALSRVVT